MRKDTFYITTAIDYTNGKPHIGHAYEKVLADAIARFHRQCGEKVFFMTGVDQHGQKIQQSAEKLGISPVDFVADITQKFIDLWARLDISHDAWAATSETTHIEVIKGILNRLHDTGQLYKKSHRGFYSIRQEQFIPEKNQNSDGTFSDEWGEVIEVDEENWYFRLTEHIDWLRDFVTKSDDFIQPKFRKSDVLNALERDGQDLCITRPIERLSWGIPLPFDENFVTYVWLDALVNYISFAGYSAEKNPDALTEFYSRWPADLHVIGKDILVPPHAVYWPCLLHALDFSDEQIPHLLVHGWWNVGGTKMSKSLGNMIDPHELIDATSVDSLRYYLLRDIVFGHDSDFSLERLLSVHNAELCNDLGNCLNRLLNMIHKYFDGQLPCIDTTPSTSELHEDFINTHKAYLAAFRNNILNESIDAVATFSKKINQYIEKSAPWQLAKNPDNNAELAFVLRESSEAITQCFRLFLPIIPESAERAFDQLNLLKTIQENKLNEDTWGYFSAGHTFGDPQPLFQKFE